LIFGALLADFSQLRLIQVIQGAAVVSIVLNLVAVWKQEVRNPAATRPDRERPAFQQAWDELRRTGQWVRRLTAVGLGSFAFAMQDVLLEPYGGQILGLSVSQTTLLTAGFAAGGIIGFIRAAKRISAGGDAHRVAATGALCGAFAFTTVIAAAPLGSGFVFALGTGLIGFGGGLFAHATLTACMRAAPRDRIGLALGAWGAAQATAAGCAIALGGLLRDGVGGWAEDGSFGAVLATPATGYGAVYLLEIALLFATLAAIGPLVRTTAGGTRPRPGLGSAVSSPS
jgi:BCD family chlorophyll transporter-like MFS transporter